MPALGLLLFMKTIRNNTPGQKVRWKKNHLAFHLVCKKDCKDIEETIKCKFLLHIGCYNQPIANEHEFEGGDTYEHR